MVHSYRNDEWIIYRCIATISTSMYSGFNFLSIMTLLTKVVISSVRFLLYAKNFHYGRKHYLQYTCIYYFYLILMPPIPENRLSCVTIYT